MILIHFSLMTIDATKNSTTSKNPSKSIQSIASTSNDNSFSQNFNLLLTVHKLNGKNYLEWAQSVKLATDGIEKLGHLTSEVTQPATNDPSLKKWQFENSLAFMWLINSIEPTIGKPHFFFTNNQGYLRGYAQLLFSLENSSQIFDLKT